MVRLELHNCKQSAPHLVSIGEYSRITTSDSSLNTIILYEKATEDQAKLKIGKYCSIGLRVTFYLGGYHNTNRISTWLPDDDMKSNRDRELLTKGDIIIENDVWIARNVTIMSGVKIGTGAVIGTNAVVTKDVEPYSIVVGNPGRAVKKRFNDEQIKILMESKWWDWEFQFIKQNSEIIFGESFENFKALVDSRKQSEQGII